MAPANHTECSPFLQLIAERDIEIRLHIDIYIVRGEAEPSDVNVVDFIVTSAKDKVTRLEAYIKELSVVDNVDEAALDLAYEELEEMYPATFEVSTGLGRGRGCRT
ncbi:putative ABC transporter ATP-binding protein C16H5.08c [Psilocybe cubensis]|uniref:Uncharacterized protein n=2 Tax=Psilocybe cubensis TaxID=181762 RepID=A0A8H8CH98_PSICU|nr:putative ABC transporter ATP-binding protein C16H5.08c [Psilocybe cubensis]KAH9474344.1 putative ABC transporter ATP-binding protein C16H5.08c [Psilocybe cubensis]